MAQSGHARERAQGLLLTQNGPSGSHQGSVRRWTRCIVGFKFRRDETLGSPAVTYEHGLAGPELGEAERRSVSVCTKISGVWGPRVRKPNPRNRLNHFTTTLSHSLSGTTTTWVRCGNCDGRIAVESSMLQMRTACRPLELLTTSQTTRAPSQAVWKPPCRRQVTCSRTSGRSSSGTINP